MIYLASPYSHPIQEIVEDRVRQTMKCLAALLRQGKFVWSPIIHNHDMTVLYDLPKDAKYWQRFSIDFLRKADGLYVLKLPGWRESVGVAEEITFANSIYLPTTYLLPEDYLK